MPGPLIQQPNMPWWADPQGASVLDPLHIALARKMTGAMGLGDPNSVMGVGAPLSVIDDAPGGLVSKLMNIPTRGRVSGPTTYREIFNRLVSRVPEVAGKLEPVSPDMTMSRPNGFASQYAQEAAIRNKFAPTAEESLQRNMIKGTWDRPVVSSPNELSDIAPTQQKTPAPPPSIGMPSGRNRGPQLLKRSGLTEDDIRSLRGMTMQQAKDKYPSMNTNTLRGIINKDVFGWIEDK